MGKEKCGTLSWAFPRFLEFVASVCFAAWQAYFFHAEGGKLHLGSMRLQILESLKHDSLVCEWVLEGSKEQPEEVSLLS